MRKHSMTTVTVDGREIFTLGRRFVKDQEYSEVTISKSAKLKCFGHSTNYPPAMTDPITKRLREENQLDVTECFIALIIYSTYFGHLYAHHQDLETILVLLPHMVRSALVVGGRLLQAGYASGMRENVRLCRTISLIPDA